jgi:hypothetical protein
MSILTTFDILGDPDELVALQDEKADSLIRPLAEKNGGISSLVVKTENGIMVVNHWENQEGMERVAAEVRPQMEAAGMPTPQNWRQYEVLRHRTPGK